MENKVFLNRYRLSLRRNGLPVELHRSLGACTYRAQQRDTGREVALTTFAPAPLDASTLELLYAQAKAACEIQQINIPRLYEVGRENGELIYVSEYCEGPTAAAWVGARGPLELTAVLRVALQVVDAMAATSFRRLYHPALNPEHIILVPGQTAEGDWPPIKIVHWFLPAAISFEQDSEIEGEHPFSSPEQRRTGEVDLASEVYSLGAIMFFLLTGVAPAGSKEGRAARLRGTPRILRHLLERMLLTDAADRPQDPVALASFLQTCLGRVERREKFNRRFALPVVTQNRLGKEKTQRAPALLFSLAIALGVLILAAFGMIVFQWPTGSEGSSAFTSGNGHEISPQERSALLSSLPRNTIAERATGANQAEQSEASDSSDELAGNDQPAHPVSPSEGLHNGTPLSVTPPAKPSATAASIAQARPNELSEMPPNEKTGALVQRDRPSSETRAGSDARSDTSSADPVVADAKGEDDATATQSAELPDIGQEPTPAAATKPRRKSTVHRVASKSGDAQTHRVTHSLKGGRAVPKLHVGGSPAELVGTTPDGHWILSVDDSGRRIIVPPPPGYGD